MTNGRGCNFSSPRMRAASSDLRKNQSFPRPRRKGCAASRPARAKRITRSRVMLRNLAASSAFMNGSGCDCVNCILVPLTHLLLSIASMSKHSHRRPNPLPFSPSKFAAHCRIDQVPLYPLGGSPDAGGPLLMTRLVQRIGKSEFYSRPLLLRL
jgi:hypothetical protein